MSSVFLEFERQVVLPLTRNDRNLFSTFAHTTKFVKYCNCYQLNALFFFPLINVISGYIINAYCFMGNFLSYFFKKNEFATSIEREWILLKKYIYSAKIKLRIPIPVIRE